MSLSWNGVMPAITTPFTADGDVDHAFLARHALWMVDAGCTATQSIKIRSISTGLCPHPCVCARPYRNRCPVFESCVMSRPAPQFAPPGAVQSVVLPATRHSRGHESFYFRVT